MAQAQQVAPSAELTTSRRTAWRLALAAILGGAALLLLWWVDPGGWALPLCGFHTATGLHCPGCGATRATHELLHGRALSALQHNALWVVSLPLVIYVAGCEARRLVVGWPLPGDLVRKPGFFVAIAVLAVLFGLLRNLPAYPFTLLTPPS